MRPVSAASLCVLLAACGGGSSSSAPPTNPPPPSQGFPDTANAIRVVTGGPRSDPEGLAPASPTTSEVTWKDARGADRRMVLGGYLYQYDFSFLGGLPDPSQEVRRTANDEADGHPGFGYVVSHNNVTGNSPLGKVNAPTLATTTAFAGKHHAIHRVELIYDRDVEPDGRGIKIPVVIEWFVATGRDHPVWAVTWKPGNASNPQGASFDVFRMDTRGPYGSLNFDGAATAAAGDAIGGVSWGDSGLRFTTTDAQLTLNSPWTYDTPNAINFARAWTANVNAEMGIVQTRAGDKEMGYQDRVVGRERGATSAGPYGGKLDCTALDDPRKYALPCIGGWPYQLMNFDWDPTSIPQKPAGEATGTKLMAWGSPYGWLGSSAFDLFDLSGTADGRGDRSYATFIVLGPKCRFGAQGTCSQPGDVEAALAAVDALASATITGASPGALVTEAPKGPGAAQKKALANGYDDAYAVYRLRAAGNQVAFTFTPGPGKPVTSPIFAIEGYAAGELPAVTVNGSARTVNTGSADSGAFASLDAATSTLWVTLHETVAAPARVAISGR